MSVVGYAKCCTELPLNLARTKTVGVHIDNSVLTIDSWNIDCSGTIVLNIDS